MSGLFRPIMSPLSTATMPAGGTTGSARASTIRSPRSSAVPPNSAERRRQLVTTRLIASSATFTDALSSGAIQISRH
jgi:hypothetical protein